jgi:TPR repeat protein
VPYPPDLSYDLETRVVLVGTTVCPRDQRSLPPLPHVKRNIRRLKRLFLDPEIVGLPAESIVTIIDREEASAILTDIAEAAAVASDTLIVYYAGHGLWGDQNSPLYLVAKNTTSATKSFSGVRITDVKNALRTSRARKRILILDCCYGGRAFEGGMGSAEDEVRAAIDVAGTYGIAAVPGDHKALAPEGALLTKFTQTLVDVLEQGLRGAPEVLTVGQIFDAVKAAANREATPLPEANNWNDGGSFKLVRNQYLRRIQLENSRKAEEERRAAQAQRKAEAAARAAEVRHKAEEAARAAEVRRQAKEEERAAEAQRKAEEEEAAEAQRKAEEEEAAEAQRKAEEERQAAEARRRAEEEKRAAEVRRKAEEEERAAAAQHQVEGGKQRQAANPQQKKLVVAAISAFLLVLFIAWIMQRPFSSLTVAISPSGSTPEERSIIYCDSMNPTTTVALAKGQEAEQGEYYREAMCWYQKAPGNADAQNRIGVLYDYGRGVPQDHEKAQVWYTKAAEQGNSAAQKNLGDHYIVGQGVPRLDYLKAMKWYFKAAEQGNADAQYNLGYMYVNGLGVDKSISGNAVQGRMWMKEASDRGNLAARQWLDAHTK